MATPPPRDRKRHARAYSGAFAASPPTGKPSESRLRRDRAPGPLWSAFALATGHGESLDRPTRRRFESRFGQDFGDVRIHTGPRAAESAKSIDALAYTVGRDVVFGDRQFTPGTAPGDRLLAHELAHTVQQRGASTPSFQTFRVTDRDEPSEREAERAADAMSSGRPMPPMTPQQAIIARDDGSSEATSQPVARGLPPEHLAKLRARAIELSVEDQSRLAAAFPEGFNLSDEDVALLAIGGEAAQGYKLRGIRVVAPAPLQAGAEAWFFRVEKGRSVLVSSPRGGPSVLLDAGTGGTAGMPVGAVELVQAVERIAGAGLGRVPERVILSHTDADHMNALNAFLRSATFSNLSVQIGQEQLRSAVGQRDWTRMGITLSATQRVIEIQVSGALSGGAAGRVHVHRLVYGDFTLTEFRSVAAAQALTTSGRTTFDKNRTSPVAVVVDMVTGGRMLYTADGTGRLFNEVVNAVGEAAFVRLLGGAGGNLRLAEYPHHGGRVAGAADVAGVLRMLRLAFDASDGSVRFITQTSAQFSGAAGASVNFLDNAGINVERVMGTTAAPGTSEATRARGGELERVTFDASGIRNVLSIAQGAETALQAASRNRHELRMLDERARNLQNGLRQAGAPAALIESIGQTRASIATSVATLENAQSGFWTEMGNAAAAPGMRAAAPMAGVTREIANLTSVTSTVNTTQPKNDLDAHEANLKAYERLFTTTVEMLRALRTQQFESLNQLRAQYRSLLIESTIMLGPAEVSAHVKTAWAATRAEFTPERMSRLSEQLGRAQFAQRAMLTHHRAQLLQSLGRQMQLNELAQRAAHGGRHVYGPGGVAYMPASTRIGVSFLLLLEIARMGLELAAEVHEANLAEEAKATRDRLLGTRTVYWWGERATPEVDLVERNFWGTRAIVSKGMSQAEILAVVEGEASANAPEYDMAVVTDVSDDDLVHFIESFYLTALNLSDWTRLNQDPSHEEVFKKWPEGWGVRLWSEKDGRYMYHIKPAIQEPLNALHKDLETGQIAQMEHAAAQAGTGSTQTIRDTAWVFGQERLAWVFNEYGGAHQLDFDAGQPRFVKRNESARIGYEEMTVVQAVDMPTYEQLKNYYWRVVTNEEYMDRYGIHSKILLYRNHEGLAMVREKSLIPAPPPKTSSATNG